MSVLSDKGFFIDDRHFLIMLASDVSDRDGLGWQLFEIVSGELIFILEIFRHDDLKKIEFISYDPISIPFETLEIIVNSFNTNGGRDFIND